VLCYTLFLGCRHRSWLREKPDFFRAPKSGDVGYILIPSCNAALEAKKSPIPNGTGLFANSSTVVELFRLFGGLFARFWSRNRLYLLLGVGRLDVFVDFRLLIFCAAAAGTDDHHESA